MTNTDTMDVVLAYVTPPQVFRERQTPPIKQLFGFTRLHLAINFRSYNRIILFYEKDF